MTFFFLKSRRAYVLTLLQRISGVGVPAAWQEKETEEPTFLMYSALGRLSKVGGSLIMTCMIGDGPALPL